jgi:hypothetical protein
LVGSAWAALAVGLACSQPAELPAPTPPAAETVARPRSAEAALSRFDSASWVTIYDPERAWNGYTLTFYKRRVPMLIDMNSRIVRSWPAARAKSRLRLLPDCSLLTIALGRAVFEYNWDGNLIWQFRHNGRFPHHDVIRLANGNTLLLLQANDRRTDDLVEVNRSGEIVWEWLSHEHLGRLIAENVPPKGNITHINSMQEIPDNPWYRQGDQSFRPGNLLISARNLSTVFVIDKETKSVVWTFDTGMDYQHEALMNGPELPDPGNIFIFNNGYKNLYAYRQSSILEIDPEASSIVWQYWSNGFYSSTGGSQQPLPNGNVLIGSSRAGRAFEVTRGGDIVWEWTPPFQLNRPQRYPYDYCPQLASLERPREMAVRPEPHYRHIDREIG